VISTIILFIGLVLIVKAGEYNLDNYRQDWTYENDILELGVFYSRPDDREALIRFRLKDGVEKHQLIYKISSPAREAPELLIKSGEFFLPFEQIDLELNSRHREKVLVLRLAEDLSYVSAYYPINLRPGCDPEINPVLNLKLFHPELAKILVHKENIHFRINSGPGRYGEEAFLVEVRTNYPGWSLKAYCNSLTMVEDGLVGGNEKLPVIPLEKLLISVNGEEPVPFKKEGLLLSSGNRNRVQDFLIQLLIDNSLADKAGEYAGAKLIFKLE